MASSVQDLEQLAHQLEHRHELLILPDRLGILLGQDGIDGRVGHARVAANDAVVNIVAHHLSAPVDFHQARLHETLHVRTQAAESGRQ